MKVFKIATIKPSSSIYEVLMKKILGIILSLFLFCGAWAQERITQFASVAQVNSQGTAVVQEDISVVAEHKNIRRGIYRDLPDSASQPVKILSLEMDGKPHPYFLEHKGDMLRVNFGNEEYIPKGEHTYRLKYEIKNVVRAFPQYDEFYWNVTGNGWSFPIEQALFEVALPEGALPNEAAISSYTGYYGQQGIPAQRQALKFWTASRLVPGQGLTVAVPWQKGIVQPPTVSGWQKYADKILLAFVLVLVVLLWGFYYMAWRKVGKDPHARVIRRFDPPEGFSAVMTGYVYYAQIPQSALAVCLSSLAVKGALEIKEETSFLAGTTYTFSLKNKQAPMLSPEEQKVLDILFAGTRTQVATGISTRPIFRAADKALSAFLAQQGAKKYFVFNGVYNLATVVALALLIIAGGMREASIMAAVLGMFMVVITYFWFNARNKSILKTLLAVGLLAVLGVFLFAILKELVHPFPIWLGIMLVAVSGGFFAWWIQSYTPLGRRVMDQIEGFKEYLEIGEGGRVELSNPAQAAQVFCDYLPYAYALGVQSKWLKAFKQKMDEATLLHATHTRGLMFSNMAMLSRGMSGLTGGSSAGGAGGGGFSGGGYGGGGGGGR